MKFILFMIAFALVLALIIWLIFRQNKIRTKKHKPKLKKVSQRKREKLKPATLTDKERKKATELLKKKPVVVSMVVKQWLRDQ